MKLYVKTIFVFLLFIAVPSTFAAGALDHFEVILWKDEAKVGEALDITISAVDKNDEIITDYTGDILVFSESDSEAEFPNDLAENSYTFTIANEGSVKFENAVKFNNSWDQDIYVYDLNDENILGVAQIAISEDEKITNADITIVSPENGITLSRDTFLVSGTAQKNHQVRILVNDTQDLFTTSNSSWIFEKEVEWLEQWTNTIQAYILDADSEKIGESKKIEIKINSNAPVFKSISTTPEWEISSESQMEVKVVATIGLREVQVIINDVITQLEEGNDWVYSATTVAPTNPGEYGIDVILKDDFALESRQREAKTITVIPSQKLNSGDVEPVTPAETVTPPQSSNELDLSIQDIQVVELKTRSVITWAELPDARSYNVYKKSADGQIELLENVKKPRFEIAITWDTVRYEDFAIKAVGQTSSGQVIQWDLSEMTKVKTGPELYIFMFLIAMLLTSGVFFMRRTQV